MEAICRLLQTGAIHADDAFECLEAQIEGYCEGNCCHFPDNDKEVFESKKAEIQKICPDFVNGIAPFKDFGNECQSDCEICASEWSWDITQLLFRRSPNWGVTTFVGRCSESF